MATLPCDSFCHIKQNGRLITINYYTCIYDNFLMLKRFVRHPSFMPSFVSSFTHHFLFAGLTSDPVTLVENVYIYSAILRYFFLKSMSFYLDFAKFT